MRRTQPCRTEWTLTPQHERKAFRRKDIREPIARSRSRRPQRSSAAARHRQPALAYATLIQPEHAICASQSPEPTRTPTQTIGPHIRAGRNTSEHPNGHCSEFYAHPSIAAPSTTGTAPAATRSTLTRARKLLSQNAESCKCDPNHPRIPAGRPYLQDLAVEFGDGHDLPVRAHSQ